MPKSSNLQITSLTLCISLSLFFYDVQGTVSFNPSFSKTDSTGIAKQTAINELGMGTMNRCVLYWENMTAAQVFWPKDREWIEQIAVTGNQSNWTLWYNPYHMNGNKPVLIGFVAGDFAEFIETLTDAQITEQAVASLRKLFNGTKDTIPDPSASLITRWKSDKFARGHFLSRTAMVLRSKIGSFLRRR
jgi:monoamine oxidase